MTQFEDKLHKAIRSTAAARAVAEIKDILTKSGFTVPKGNTLPPNARKSELEEKILAFYAQRTAELEAQEVKKVAAALTDTGIISQDSASKENSARPAPVKSGRVAPKTSQPKIANTSPEATTPTVVTEKLSLPTAPIAPAPAVTIQPVDIGTTLNFKNTDCGIADFGNAVGYCVSGNATRDSAQKHLDANLDKILGSLLAETPQAIQGAKNRIKSQQRALAVGAPDAHLSTSGLQSPIAEIVECLGTIQFEIGGVAVVSNPSESILSALGNHLLKANACSALVYATAEGEFRADLAQAMDRISLHEKILGQLGSGNVD